MREALSLATRARGRTSPNPMVGALVVKDEKVVGRGFHSRAGNPHAETVALADAGRSCTGATLYCTLEPCCHHGRTPPCTRAVLDAGIVRVVAAVMDPSAKVRGRGIAELREAGVEVEVGCLEQDARLLNEVFFTFHELGRPFVTLKWAMTLDGRTATDADGSRWITGEDSRRYVHELRSEHDAILVGIGTVKADDPSLKVRLEGYDGPQPKRIVLDSKLSISPSARLLHEPDGGEVILATTSLAPKERRGELEQEGHRVIVLPEDNGEVDIEALKSFLSADSVLSVFCEGGRRIHTALLGAGFADKVVAFVAPKIIGGGEVRSPLLDLHIGEMDRAIRLRRTRWITFDPDVCLVGYLRDI